MKRSSFPLASLALLGAGTTPAAAALAPKALVVDGSDVPFAVVHEHGVFFRGDGDVPLFGCRAAAGDVRFAAATGDGRLLVAGESGPRFTSNQGCHWKDTVGPVDARTVVALHQAEPGVPEVLFAVDDVLGPETVFRTADGGFTSEPAGDLSLLGFELAGMVGRGDEVWVVAVSGSGEVFVFRSEDLGATFVEVGDALEAGPPIPRPLAAGPEGLWIERGGALLLVGPGGETVEDRTFAEGIPLGAAIGPGDRLFVAIGAEGLERRNEDGSWKTVRSGEVVAVAADAEAIWAGLVAAGAGDPMVEVSADAGETWKLAFAAPAAWTYGTICASLGPQTCAADAEALEEALGIATPPADDAGEDPGEGGGGGCQAAGASGPALATLLLLATWTSPRGPRRRRQSLTTSRGDLDTPPSLGPGPLAPRDSPARRPSFDGDRSR